MRKNKNLPDITPSLGLSLGDFSPEEFREAAEQIIRQAGLTTKGGLRANNVDGKIYPEAEDVSRTMDGTTTIRSVELDKPDIGSGLLYSSNGGSESGFRVSRTNRKGDTTSITKVTVDGKKIPSIVETRVIGDVQVQRSLSPDPVTGELEVVQRTKEDKYQDGEEVQKEWAVNSGKPGRKIALAMIRRAEDEANGVKPPRHVRDRAKNIAKAKKRAAGLNAKGISTDSRPHDKRTRRNNESYWY